MANEEKKIVNLSLEQKQLVKKGVLKMHASGSFLQDPVAKKQSLVRSKHKYAAGK